MSLSEREGQRRALLAAGLLGACAVALSGCQVRPLYAGASSPQEKLNSIVVEPASTRVAQQVRNRLVFLLHHGGAAPTEPAYRLALGASASATGVFIDGGTNRPAAGDMRVTVTYQLKDAKTQAVLKAGSRSAIAAYDLPTQEFARLRSTRDAEDRAAEAAAALVMQDIAGFLAR